MEQFFHHRFGFKGLFVNLDQNKNKGIAKIENECVRERGSEKNQCQASLNELTFDSYWNWCNLWT